MKSHLVREISRTHRELAILRDEYLPVILSIPLDQSMPNHIPDPVRQRSSQTSKRLSVWQSAITQLMDHLPIDASISKPKEDDFVDFMFTLATPNLDVTEARIRWKISVCIPVDWSEKTFWPSFFPALETPEERERYFRTNKSTLVKQLVEMSVFDSMLMNSLCLIVPLIADDDPALAKVLLDPRTWKTLAEANSNLTTNEREEIIQQVEQGYFPHVLNNALLHVFAALANNHFLVIRDFLGHPCLYGSYTGLMPHYLFAILFQKVVQFHHLTELFLDSREALQ